MQSSVVMLGNWQKHSYSLLFHFYQTSACTVCTSIQINSWPRRRYKKLSSNLESQIKNSNLNVKKKKQWMKNIILGSSWATSRYCHQVWNWATWAPPIMKKDRTEEKHVERGRRGIPILMWLWLLYTKHRVSAEFLYFSSDANLTKGPNELVAQVLNLSTLLLISHSNND